MSKIKWPQIHRNSPIARRLLGLGVAGALTFSACSLISGSASAQTIHRTGQNPDYHVVDKGDTLWDLSGSYYGDSYEWPRLWGFNAHVTNPHWIYPGDIVYLKTPVKGAVDAPMAETAPVQDGNVILPVAGFVSAERVEYSGEIFASPKEASMLAELDTVWIGPIEKEEGEEEESKPKPSPFHAGEVYAVVREVGEVQGKNADGEESVVGYKYLVIGAIRVKETSEKHYDTAIVEQSWIEMQRGDRLIPYERQLKSSHPVQSDKDMVAQIVDSIDGTNYFAEHQYVWVNKGADDGVRPGNRLFVYQRFEGLDFHSSADEKVPWQRVGQLMLLDVRKNFSMAVITNSTREIVIGDRLEMYKGR